jgi:hypothetical protein
VRRLKMVGGIVSAWDQLARPSRSRCSGLRYEVLKIIKEPRLKALHAVRIRAAMFVLDNFKMERFLQAVITKTTRVNALYCRGVTQQMPRICDPGPHLPSGQAHWKETQHRLQTAQAPAAISSAALAGLRITSRISTCPIPLDVLRTTAGPRETPHARAAVALLRHQKSFNCVPFLQHRPRKDRSIIGLKSLFVAPVRNVRLVLVRPFEAGAATWSCSIRASLRTRLEL